MVDVDPSLDYKEAASRLAYKALDVTILRFLLFAKDHEEMGPIGKAFIAQLRLIATLAEMTPYLTIKASFGDGYTKGMTLPGVGMKWMLLQMQKTC